MRKKKKKKWRRRSKEEEDKEVRKKKMKINKLRGKKKGNKEYYLNPIIQLNKTYHTDSCVEITFLMVSE